MRAGKYKAQLRQYLKEFAIVFAEDIFDNLPVVRICYYRVMKSLNRIT
jgi:hypothetical protein